MEETASLSGALSSGRPLPAIVFDNGGDGEIRRKLLARAKQPVGVDLPAPDFPRED